MSEVFNLLIIGAHPDDAEYSAGGYSIMSAEQGANVLHVAVTNGDKGHQRLGGAALAQRRHAEAHAAAAACGAKAIVLDNHDGELMPTLENRYKIIRIIREFKPDLVLFHRINDYHPDHRYTGQLVQDALYMIRVQNVLPHTKAMAADPVAMYVHDVFQKPYPLQPDVVIDIDEVYDRKIAAIGKHECQMFEWMPFIAFGVDESDVPAGAEGRQAWLKEELGKYQLDPIADRFRDALIAKYGSERGSKISHAEVFELCELGSPLTDEARARFFPF